MSKKEIKFNKLTQGVKTGLATIGMISFFPSLVQASQVGDLPSEQAVQPAINQDMNSIPERILHFQGGVPPGVTPLQNQYCPPPPYYNQGWQQQWHNPYQQSYWHGAGYYAQYTYPTTTVPQAYSAQYTYSVVPGRYSYQRPQFQPQARVMPQPPPYMVLPPPPVNNGGGNRSGGGGNSGGGNSGGGGGGNSGGS